MPRRRCGLVGKVAQEVVGRTEEVLRGELGAGRGVEEQLVWREGSRPEVVNQRVEGDGGGGAAAEGGGVTPGGTLPVLWGRVAVRSAAVCDDPYGR